MSWMGKKRAGEAERDSELQEVLAGLREGVQDGTFESPEGLAQQLQFLQFILYLRDRHPSAPGPGPMAHTLATTAQGLHRESIRHLLPCVKLGAGGSRPASAGTPLQFSMGVFSQKKPEMLAQLAQSLEAFTGEGGAPPEPSSIAQLFGAGPSLKESELFSLPRLNHEMAQIQNLFSVLQIQLRSLADDPAGGMPYEVHQTMVSEAVTWGRRLRGLAWLLNWEKKVAVKETAKHMEATDSLRRFQSHLTQVQQSLDALLAAGTIVAPPGSSPPACAWSTEADSDFERNLSAAYTSSHAQAEVAARLLEAALFWHAGTVMGPVAGGKGGRRRKRPIGGIRPPVPQGMSLVLSPQPAQACEQRLMELGSQLHMSSLDVMICRKFIQPPATAEKLGKAAAFIHQLGVVKQHTTHVLKCIAEREKVVSRFHQLEKEYTSIPDQGKAELGRLLYLYQVTTVAVYRSISHWRTSLARPYAFECGGVNYLMKILNDCAALDAGPLRGTLALKLHQAPMCSNLTSLPLFRESAASLAQQIELPLGEAEMLAQTNPGDHQVLEGELHEEASVQHVLLNEMQNAHQSGRYIPFLDCSQIIPNSSVGIKLAEGVQGQWKGKLEAATTSAIKRLKATEASIARHMLAKEDPLPPPSQPSEIAVEEPDSAE